MTRVLYYTKANLSLHRAHVYNILRTTEELRKNGIRVEIVQSAVKLLRRRNDFDILYYRDPRLILTVFFVRLFLRKKIVLELHSISPSFFRSIYWWLALRLADGIVFFTYALRKKYPQYDAKSTVVLGNTYDPKQFGPYRNVSQRELRIKLGLPLDKKLAVYTGSTLTYNFEPIIQAVHDTDIMLVIIGVVERDGLTASDKVIVRARTGIDTALQYQLASDILIVPSVKENSDLKHRLGTFPVKIFEYLGVGKPIVSFMNESIPEVLAHNKNAFLIDPPTVENWRRAFDALVNDRDMAHKLASRALADSRKYTWGVRGREVSNFLKTV